MSTGDNAYSTDGDSLGVVAALTDKVDPVALVSSLTRALARTWRRPAATRDAFGRFAFGMGTTALDLATRRAGNGAAGNGATGSGKRPHPRDARFADPAWADNPFFYGLQRTYELSSDLLRDLVKGADLGGAEGAKAEFAAGLLADALAPTNALLTNPTAVKRAYDTAGVSVARGVRNFARDVVQNKGWPSQVDRRPFKLGKTTACTPGKVVFRNELVEVLQYEPQTEDVFEIPLLVCAPWINRYYIADLAPGKSLIEWAVQHGHTTFAISYRNPDSSMRELTFDDYMRLGPMAALEVARDVTGAETVNMLSICLAGAMTTAIITYLDRCDRQVVHTSTLLNTAIDCRDAGMLATVFADPGTIDGLARRMEKKGFLPGKEMARTFDLLRANDLVFRYLVDGWLLGQDPPAFDLLAWNADSMNIPGKAHAHFLRTIYRENDLARDEFVAFGERLSLGEVTTDTYIVAAVDDHIAPWRSSYRTTGLLKGPLRFVLSSAGHIAGIVNPPNPKARLWLNDVLPEDADEWRAGAVEHADTWWNDWAAWIGGRSGSRVPPPPMGGPERHILGEAPGTYVRG